MNIDGPRLVWMRHGTCGDGLQEPAIHAWPDSPLTALGRVEAAVTARRLESAGWRPAVVVASPLPRTVATATLVASHLGSTLGEPDLVFAEWAAPYCVRGLGPMQYPPEYLDWQRKRNSDPDSALPGGESLRALRKRTGAARDHARQLANRFGRVLVVSHKVLIGSVAALDRGVSDPSTMFDIAREFPLLPAGLWPVPPDQGRAAGRQRMTTGVGEPSTSSSST
ncbi:MAG: histidine phosphatase family protein [Micromonosporaceae bacterium]